MAIEATISRIGLTFLNAVVHYILYRFVVFLIILAKDALIASCKNLYKLEYSKRSIGTSSTEPISPEIIDE